MQASLLQSAATVAQTYNESGAFETESFRFKSYDNLGKSELFTLRNADLIVERDDAWSRTTWEWSDEALVAIAMVETSPITDASDSQLSALAEHADVLLDLPRADDFLASEYDLIGQQIQTLSSTNLIEKSGSRKQLGIWELTNYARRLLTSLEAEAMRNE